MEIIPKLSELGCGVRNKYKIKKALGGNRLGQKPLLGTEIVHLKLLSAHQKGNMNVSLCVCVCVKERDCVEKRKKKKTLALTSAGAAPVSHSAMYTSLIQHLQAFCSLPPRLSAANTLPMLHCFPSSPSPVCRCSSPLVCCVAAAAFLPSHFPFVPSHYFVSFLCVYCFLTLLYFQQNNTVPFFGFCCCPTLLLFFLNFHF